MKRSLQVLLVLVLLSIALPVPDFEPNYSNIVTSNKGELLGARIAADGQWRFKDDSICPPKFEACLLTFEDRYFRKHFGINPFALANAVKDNVQKGTRRGGSTLTMQLARMLQGNQSRTYVHKAWEALLALHLELNLSKDEILNRYVNHAPFGGNVVGLKAAAWRYYGRSPAQLSWSESALLAVLPNSPSLLYPGKGEKQLRAKRDRLLDRLVIAGFIDEEQARLGKMEPVPLKPSRLPYFGQHALLQAAKRGKEQSNLSLHLQQQVQDIVDRQVQVLSGNEVHNAAAMVVEVKTGKIRAYVGNTSRFSGHGHAVNLIEAPRSTGSILKPFLYTAALDKGLICSKQILPDIPSFYAGYTPKNYFENFDGVVPADEALYRSLNIPFVRLLKEYSIPAFHNKLLQQGGASLKYSADHYGLSLILGGGELKLRELALMYTKLARTLNRFNRDGLYDERTIGELALFGEPKMKKNPRTFSAGGIYKCFEALTKLKRPDSETGWSYFGSSRNIAWKTGTSFGHKDAWAIGVTPEYVVATWAGNASGEGRKGLKGVSSAAPILFEIFQRLPATSWFQKPYDELQKVRISRQSGMIAGPYSDFTDSSYEVRTNSTLPQCKYSKRIFVNEDGTQQVRRDCYDGELKTKNYFVLPPIEEWYFQKRTATYDRLPPMHPNCENQSDKLMRFAYPSINHRLYIPKELDGSRGKIVLELVHRNSELKVFWHLDDQYLGRTQGEHKFALDAKIGWHTLTVVDEKGHQIIKRIEILN